MKRILTSVIFARSGAMALVLAVALVTGCAPRAELVDYPATNEIESLPVYIATTRARDASGDFGAGRKSDSSYLRYDITVPPDRPPGKILFPNGRIDPQRQFLATARTEFETASAFQTSLGRHIRKVSPREREAVIFVHGYNNNFAEGVLRLSQLIDDFGGGGAAIHYSWPSAGNALAYEYDQQSVLFARDGLESLIKQVRRAGARRVVIVAHSMGAMLAMEALRQIDIASPGSASRLVDGVVLLSAHISVDVFKSQLARLEPLPQPFLVFVSRRDRALLLAGRISGEKELVGNMENYDALRGFDLTVLDVSQFSEGIGHFSQGDSPTLLKFMANLPELRQAFDGDRSARSGLLSGVVLTVQNAAEIIVTPVTRLTQ